MGKFQLNKKGEDPIKIYEDTFKIANDTVETHLGKLGKMPNPISRERLARDGEQTYTGYYSRPKGAVPQTGNCPNCGHDVSAHSGANTGDNLCYGGDNCDCGRTFPWIKESKASEWKSVEAIAKEAISEDEKDDIFQYLFDLQESGITNMFGAGPYVEREFPHLDKKEVRDVVLEWMKNYETIHARMGIES
ncbi:MAG: hypothetical protein JRE23_15615, partial [Deltaproteobacteria bacterium]|nr:hypothetical protein [Deltaproteobacteria bacterium]